MIAAGADYEKQFSLTDEYEASIERSPTSVGDQSTPHRQAAALAQRLEAIGINPYQSDKERYLVALQDGPGEVIDLGRPLRGTRLFASHAVRKNRPVVQDFESFAVEDGLKDCLYWGIGLTGAKAEAADLREAMKRFNDRINIEFSELRKRFAFELLLLVVHPRFDPVSGLFDLHAHFVARIAPEGREAVRRRLMTKFSKIDLPDSPIRKAAAIATYMLWGIFRNKVMITWPDYALKAVWGLTQSRFRFVRSGGAFAKWKASRRSPEETVAVAVDKGQRKRNRAETAGPRRQVFTGDRLLSKVMVKIRGVRVAALLFEAARSEDAEVVETSQADAGSMYPSATVRVTQESQERHADTSCSAGRPSTDPFWHGLSNRLSRAKKVVSSWGTKIVEFARAAIRWLL
ncbi:hypothetical protein [Rhizobium sp. TRM95796]|uniref:hypothetical protein n=1 Tax=Rhizobium sp. TRM95796 TaxID=2979862 RepID=UPI0021E9673E|nr:hypothetical protein [Rhizobium sp. TRM95796]MCV3765158.1 hypothetical protein [Rhizobium sp. TRM95796]